MKKEYRKPEIVFESFALSTNIASNCSIDTDLPTYQTCGVELPGIVGAVFSDTVNGCKVKVKPDNILNDYYCYHVPTDSRSLFNS